MFYIFARDMLRVLFFILGGLKSVGRENIPRTGGVIVASNHISNLDPPAVGAGMRRQVRFMAKEELFHPEICGIFMRCAGTFPVRRSTADRKAIKRAIELLDQGNVVGIFPEGTRSEDGKLREPELGLGLIALKSRAAVIPTAVIGTDKILPLHAKRFYFHKAKIVYGEPLTFPDLYDASDSRQAMEEIGRRVMAAIADLLAKHTL